MSAQTLYPYPRLFGETVLNVKAVDVDGHALPGRYINEDARTVDLTGANEDWKTAALHVQVKCPDDALDPTRPWGKSVAVMATLHCSYSNGRQSVFLDQDPANPGIWTGELELAKDFWYQRGTLAATAFALVDGVPHRVVADTAPWTVGFDPMSPIIQTSGALPIKWVDFKNPADDADLKFLKEFANDPWFIDLHPQNPRLLLNRSVEGLYPLLSDETGKLPPQKAAKALIEGAIAAKVWDAFFAAAIEAVDIDPTTGEPIEPAEEWQATVLRILLRRMYPHHEHSDALKEAAQSRRGDAAAALQQLLSVATDQQSRVPKAIRDAAHLLRESD